MKTIKLGLYYRLYHTATHYLRVQVKNAGYVYRYFHGFQGMKQYTSLEPSLGRSGHTCIFRMCSLTMKVDPSWPRVSVYMYTTCVLD